eukprot:2410007-Rhodomonas_salina.2
MELRERRRIACTCWRVLPEPDVTTKKAGPRGCGQITDCKDFDSEPSSSQITFPMSTLSDQT